MEDYLSYLNQSPTVFFKCKNEPNWPIEFVTSNVFEIFGYEAKDFTNGIVSFADLVFDDDKEQLSLEIEALSSFNGDKYEFKPYRMVNKSKKQLWVQDITNLIRDEEGNITHFNCYITDFTNHIKLVEKLDVSEDIISTIYNNSFQFIGLLEPNGTLIKANKTALEFAGIKEEDVIGKKFWDCPWWQHSIEGQDILKEDILKASKGEFIRENRIHYDLNGNKIYIDFSIKPVFNSKHEVIYLIPEGHNITQSVNKEIKLKKSMDIINENVLISTTDLEGRIIECSDKFVEVSGFSKEELLGNRHNIMKHPDNKDSVYENMWKSITKGEIWKDEHRNLKKNGDTFWVENIITPNLDYNDEIISYTSIYNDITLRKEVSELLITDELTQLYNRRHFNTIFDKELKRCRRHNNNFIMMIIDVDYFKQYNDIYGHLAGDIVLKKVAQTLKACLKRAEDFIFRLGGEEFCVISSKMDSTGVLDLVNELKDSIENLNIEHTGNKTLQKLTISIGVKVVDPLSKLTYEDIYKKADNLLYKAKDSGRNKVEIEE